MQTYSLNIRPRRQTTFPRKLLEEVGVKVGDKFDAKVKGKEIILKAKKQIALDAFKELQKAFQESGIPEKEFQESIKRDREKYARKNYPSVYR